MPEYKNKNKAQINLEINEMNNHISSRKKRNIGSILKIFYEMKAKKIPLSIQELLELRKGLLQRLETLQESIEKLPVPQNSNNGYYNKKPKYNEPVNRLKPKPKSKPNQNMTKHQELKIQRKKVENLSSQSHRQKNLQKTEEVYSNKLSQNSRAFLDANKAREVNFNNLTQDEIKSAYRAINNLGNKPINFTYY